MKLAELMNHKRVIVAIAAAALAVVAALSWRQFSSSDDTAVAANPSPVLTITATTVASVTWPSQVEASGAIAPWQEALVGARITGLPLAEVRAEVGDTVKRGQLLARFDDRMVRAEIAQAEANLAQARAEAHEAAANRDRALAIESSGALSKQQVLQSVTQAETAIARQGVAEASLAAARLKLENTRVIAPDDGLISARNATLGQVADAASSGDLFRLIRQGRLEWRAELTPAQVAQVRTGSKVTLSLPDGTEATGTVRQVAPALDPNSRLGMAYVDLDAAGTARASMYVSGRIDLAQSAALVVPGESVVIRDGRSYVFALQGNRAAQVAVTTGRRVDGQIEIVDGLDPGARIAVRGAGFLNDGDIVAVAPAATQG
jgi:RND family efflux transporter MFP subunit